MNQLNSCLFEGTVTELDCALNSVSFILEISRTTKVNGKNVKEITELPVLAALNLVQKDFKELTGHVLRVVGRMASLEINGVLSLLCIAEHIDVKP